MDRLPIVRCKCGAEFLLIPDLAEMERTVEKHAKFHSKKEPDSAKAEKIFKEIQDYLIMEILRAASTIERAR